MAITALLAILLTSNQSLATETEDYKFKQAVEACLAYRVAQNAYFAAIDKDSTASAAWKAWLKSDLDSEDRDDKRAAFEAAHEANEEIKTADAHREIRAEMYHQAINAIDVVREAERQMEDACNRMETAGKHQLPNWDTLIDECSETTERWSTLYNDAKKAIEERADKKLEEDQQKAIEDLKKALDQLRSLWEEGNQ